MSRDHLCLKRPRDTGCACSPAVTCLRIVWIVWIQSPAQTGTQQPCSWAEPRGGILGQTELVALGALQGLDMEESGAAPALPGISLPCVQVRFLELR